MIRHITLMEVLKLHSQIIDQSGGAQGIRDLGLLESAVAQP
jgi:death on curing protein